MPENFPNTVSLGRCLRSAPNIVRYIERRQFNESEPGATERVKSVLYDRFGFLNISRNSKKLE